jgi:hypothetical protein
MGGHSVSPTLLCLLYMGYLLHDACRAGVIQISIFVERLNSRLSVPWTKQYPMDQRLELQLHMAYHTSDRQGM